jgi:hypothetical protein
MCGLVTERDFEAAEESFPGIGRFYRSMTCKPATFLELVWAYLEQATATHMRLAA